MSRFALRCVLASIVGGALVSAAHGQTQEGKTADAGADSPPTSARQTAPVMLEPIDVYGHREQVNAGPMPGLELTRDQLPSNVQMATYEDLRDSHALGLGDFFNAQFQGVSVNDYQGNPFQVDVNFRGFTASPQIGTAQGLSVFVDGVRANEPFGDVVNWDLLPLNAIDQVALFPGSNPLFGLNTLGGAISLRTRSGFGVQGFDGEASGGSWGRKQVKVSGGGSSGEFAGFAALSYFDEDGWRDNSPSTVKQGFLRGDWKRGEATATATALLARNDLIGNGLVPIELYEKDPSSVYTSPDETRNRLSQFQLSTLMPLTEKSNITAMVYRRDSRRSGVNGDIYDGFTDFDSHDAQPQPPTGYYEGIPVCQYADPDGTGVNYDLVQYPGAPGEPDFYVQQPRQPLNSPCSTYSIRGPNPRNGAHGPFDGYDGNFNKYPGVVEGTPIGVISRSDVGQVTYGGGAQFNFNLDDHKFMFGAEYHSSDADYSATQQLALIDASHQVYTDPDNIDPLYRAGQVPITINAFTGSDHTFGAYFSDTWTVRSNVFVSIGGRYNLSKVSDKISARTGIDLHEIHNDYRGYVLCPSADPASCPAPTLENMAGYKINDLSAETKALSGESFTYKSFNPSLGINWLPTPQLNLFANISQGTRVPSVVELGCAYDASPVLVWPGFVDEGSGQVYPPVYQPRSLAGPTCSLPTSLSGDPFLPQIHATSGEIGARGQLPLARGFEWNLSVFRTDLRNDIYLVGVSPERSYFQTVGDTRRQGFELGLKGSVNRFDLRLNYSMIDATFEDPFYVSSPHNSSADFNQNSDPLSVIRATGAGYPAIPSPTMFANEGNGTYHDILVEPGSHMPGVPLQNLNAGAVFHFTPAFNAGLSLIAHSKAYVRGNENNQHQTGGTDQETGFFYYPCQGAPCAIQQFPTAAGQAFTDKGTTPGFVIFNLDAEYEILRGLKIFSQITNLFDTGYTTAGRLGVNPFSPSIYGAIGPSGFNYNSTDWRNTTFVGPGAPRGYFVGLSYEFGKPQ